MASRYQRSFTGEITIPEYREELTPLVLPLTAPEPSGNWTLSAAMPTRSLARSITLFARRHGRALAAALLLGALAGVAFVLASGGGAEASPRPRTPALAPPARLAPIVTPAPAAAPAPTVINLDQDAPEAEIVIEPEAEAAPPPAARPAPSAPARPRAAARALLLINAKPPCEILVDGKATGLHTPQRALALAPGERRITLVNREYGVTRSWTLHVEAGESRKLIVDFTDEMR